MEQAHIRHPLGVMCQMRAKEVRSQQLILRLSTLDRAKLVSYLHHTMFQVCNKETVRLEKTDRPRNRAGEKPAETGKFRGGWE